MDLGELEILSLLSPLYRTQWWFDLGGALREPRRAFCLTDFLRLARSQIMLAIHSASMGFAPVASLRPTMQNAAAAVQVKSIAEDALLLGMAACLFFRRSLCGLVVPMA